jgi:tetratricopeptide (TPR) repeat protein
VKFLVSIAALLLLLGSCEEQDNRLSRLIQMEDPDTPPGPERIAQLENVVDEYEDAVSDQVQLISRQADAMKFLAQAYLQQQLYGPALETLQEVLVIQPQNQTLHQLAGAAAGFVGKSQPDGATQTEYYRIAEYHYERAIALDPRFINARYGLAVLYVFELNEPIKALPHLDAVLGINDTHVPSLFVLARAHVQLGDIDEAINAYDRIIQGAADEQDRERARRNRQLLLGGGS